MPLPSPTSHPSSIPRIPCIPWLTILLLILSPLTHADPPPPETALKYHEALLKNPHNPTLYARFHDAWIDEQPLESLTTFLQSKADNKNPTDLTILTHHLLRRGLEDQALETLNSAITSLPDDPNLLSERAKILLRRLEFDPAHKDLEIVANSSHPTLSIEAAKLIGKSHLRQGNPAAATTAWENLLKKHPKNEEILEDLIELTASFDQFDQAIQYANLLIQNSQDPFKKIQTNIRLGELLAASGKADQAISTWSKSLSQTGEDSWLETEIIARISSHFRKLDRLDLLTSHLDTLAKENPRRLHIHRELAKLEASQGNIDSAIGRFREILRRSPGNDELRNEFIRILIDSQRFDDASEELQKILTLTPDSPETYLRLADLTYQKSQANPDLDPKKSSPEILKHLEKSLELLDPSEASGLRIANLMLRYGLEPQGETLLQKLSTAPNATSTPAETLAAEYIRTKRKDQALEILTNLTKSTDPDTVLRATLSLAPITDPETPFQILLNRLPDFPNNPSYLAALIKQSLPAKKPTDAIPSALKLVRLSKLPTEIQDATRLATSLITAAEKTAEITTQLSAIPQPSTPETCLLASLLELQKEYQKTDTLLQNTTDPTLLRFHSSLLAARGEFAIAISTLQRLPENSASYFKELSELQIRSGDTPAALQTIDQWIIAAPTDKNPWIISSRLHQEKSDIAKAIDTTRRALARFANDEDLTASLASLYQQSGNLTEAELILWKLYDQAPDPSSQARYASRLSLLAQSTGKTLELKESLLLRSRNNSQSLGPILALAELARTTNDNIALLEHLHQALRLKPKDIDIRIQIANTEKQNGNLQKQIDILNDGLTHDTNNRIRSSLAQAYIDQGDALKGLHILRSISGDSATDPRFLETTATSLASSGMIPEAIQYLQESLPKDADWRIRFVLAELLAQDGRELEAIPIFISLLNAETEIPNLPAPNFGGHPFHHRGYYSVNMGNTLFLPSQPNQTPSPAYDTPLLIREAAQASQFAQHNPWAGRNMPKALPSFVREVRARSIIQLAIISSAGNPEFTSQIQSANIPDLPFVIDIIASISFQGQQNILPLLKKYPERHDLLPLALQYGQLSASDPETLDLLKKIITSPNLDPLSGLQALNLLISADPENIDYWQKIHPLVSQAIETPSPQTAHSLYYPLINILTQNVSKIPESQLPEFRKSFLNFIDSDNFDGYQRIQYKSIILSLFQDFDAWIDSINLGSKYHQQQLAEKSNKPPQNQPQHFAYQYYLTLTPPNLYNLPFHSVIGNSLYYLIPAENRRNAATQFPIEDILKNIDRFESPLIRAWIAFHSKDQKIIGKYLSASHPEIEKTDFILLKALNEFDSKNHPEACRLLIELSKPTPQPSPLPNWASTSFIAISENLTPEQLPEFKKPLHTAIQTLIKTHSVNPWASENIYGKLLEISKKHEFDDLVTTLSNPSSITPSSYGRRPTPPTIIKPSAPAAIAPAPSNTPSGQPTRPTTPQSRIQDLASKGKTTAAAVETLNYIRTQKKNGYSDTLSIVSNLREYITPQLTKKIISISNPGNSPSLSKHLEYIDICRALNEPAKALASLRALSKKRPFDPAISADLAFSLTSEKPAPSTSLLDKAISRVNSLKQTSDFNTALSLLQNAASSPTFATSVNSASQRFRNFRNNEASFAHFLLITKFLETTDPEKIHPLALTSLSSHTYAFFTGNYLQNLRSLDYPSENEKQDNPDATRHRDIARQLAQAMSRHPALAETGFRMIHSAKWFDSPEQLDQLAKSTLLSEIPPSPNQYRNENGNDIHSSASWICSRIKESSPEKIITPDFLESIQKSNPTLASLLSAFLSIKSKDDIAKFWENGTLTLNRNASRSSYILYNNLISHIAKIAGSSQFFVSTINSLTPEEIQKSDPNTGQPIHLPLFIAAIKSCQHQNAETIQKICSAISKAIHSDTPATNSNNILYYLFSNIFDNDPFDPVTSSHIIRSFDTTRTPIQNYNSFYNTLSRNKITDHKSGIEFLENLGLLNDTPKWKPLAVSSFDNRSNNGVAQQTIIRTYIEEQMMNYFPSPIRQTEFITHLENRKPQTFGALITAANLSSSSERSRLYAKAFKHAAPYLAKASPKHLDDFALLLPYLPQDAITSLPKSLQQKSRELHEKKIAMILENAEQRLSQTASNPSYSPLYQLMDSFRELSQYDLQKTADLFLRTDAIHEKNSAFLAADQANMHESALAQVIESLSDRNNHPPENALIFYRLIRNSPRSHRFGISDRQSRPFITYIGESFAERNISNDTPSWLTPWIDADKLPDDLKNDIFAAITSYNLLNNTSFPYADFSPQLDKYKISPKARELITACATIVKAGYNDDVNLDSAANTLLSLLTDPSLSLDFRTQLAFTTTAQHNQLLSHPTTADTLTSLITAYCETDHSILNTNLSQTLRAISSSNKIDPSLPQFKKLDQAFWKNANSPKPRGHRAIPADEAQALFITAILIKDDDAIKHIFPHIRPSNLGNLDTICSLILNDHFDLASKLISDQNALFYYNRSRSIDPELEQKLNAFCESLENPDQALRLRCNMSRLFRPENNEEFRERHDAYLQSLVEIYRKTPPSNPSTNIEVLSYIATSLNPAEAILQKEITAAAAPLDIKSTLRSLTSAQNDRIEIISQHQHEFHILRQAAMIQLLDGDPTLFISICNEFSSYAKTGTNQQYQRLLASFSHHPKGSPVDTFLKSTAQWISVACARGKTESFSKIIRPLRNLTLSFAETKNDFNNHLYPALALHSFISHWEDKPDDLIPLVSKHQHNEYTVKSFTTRNDAIPFISLLYDIQTSPDMRNMGPEPFEFLTAILSRESLKPILLSRASYLNFISPQTEEHREKLNQFFTNPPDSLSPTGKLLLRYNRATKISIPKDTLDPYRSLIKDTPDTPDWLHFKINSKLNLITKILHTNSEITEARQIIDSIDPNTIPESQKNHYNAMQKRIISAEQKK